MRNVFQTYFDDEWKQLRKSSDHYYLRYYLVIKARYQHFVKNKRTVNVDS